MTLKSVGVENNRWNASTEGKGTIPREMGERKTASNPGLQYRVGRGAAFTLPSFTHPHQHIIAAALSKMRLFQKERNEGKQALISQVSELTNKFSSVGIEKGSSELVINGGNTSMVVTHSRAQA